MASTSLPFPMVKADISLLLPAALTQDINTLWLRTYTGPMTSLAAAAQPADTTLSLVKPPLEPLVGETILVDGEPMVVTAISADGLTLTVTRYLQAFPFMAMLPIQPSGAHAAGASVYVLTYETPWVYIAEVYLRPNVTNDVKSLGRDSVSFGTIASGSLSLNTASGSSGTSASGSSGTTGSGSTSSGSTAPAS